MRPIKKETVFAAEYLCLRTDLPHLALRGRDAPPAGGRGHFRGRWEVADGGGGPEGVLRLEHGKEPAVAYRLLLLLLLLRRPRRLLLLLLPGRRRGRRMVQKGLQK